MAYQTRRRLAGLLQHLRRRKAVVLIWTVLGVSSVR